MSMEHQEPQQSAGQQETSSRQDGTPATGQSVSSNGQGGSREGQRRRRRRRKGGKNPSAAALFPVDGAPAQPANSIEAAPSASGDSPRDTHRDQPRDARPAASPEQGRDQQQHQRQARPQQSNHTKKQGGRQNKGGSGSSNGGGSNGGSSNGGGARENRHFQKGSQAPPREYNPGNSAQPFANGGNGSNGGGMRRKNKVRRPAPGFVGPMDHSYRVANGNIADGPPSTMDFRSGGSMANGNVNGNVYVRSNYPDSLEAAVPVILRDDAPSRILCFIEDLFIVAKMQETARKLGVKVSFAKADKDIVTRLGDAPEAERPSLIVFDLNNANAKPLTLIPKLKAKLKRGTSVIGFLSHIQGDLKGKAMEAGCDMVMPKSAFSQNLPNLLRRHGLDEELEAVEA